VLSEDKDEIRKGRDIKYPENYGNSGNEEAECIIDCVAFFYVKGRLGEYYQPKNNFRSSARSEERRPSKLQNLQNINPTSQLLT